MFCAHISHHFAETPNTRRASEGQSLQCLSTDLVTTTPDSQFRSSRNKSLPKFNAGMASISEAATKTDQFRNMRKDIHQKGPKQWENGHENRSILS